MPLKILLVEDNAGDVELVREGMENIIKPNSLEIAENGMEALSRLQQDQSYALLIVDLNLPLLSGLELIKKLRSSDNSHHQLIPIIVFSSSKAPNDIKKSYLYGANCFITKPIDYQIFKNRLTDLLRFWLEDIENPLRTI